MTALGTISHGGEGRSFTVGADLLTVKGVSPSDAFSVVEYHAAAGVPGPPPHVHHRNEEAFFVLDGEVEFQLDGTTSVLRAGSFAHVPAGAVHTFANIGTTPARWVGIFAPGRYVGLVEELGAALPPDGPPDPAAVAAVFARWETEQR
jgi:quercetin dioxygenase-like cupin family protein